MQAVIFRCRPRFRFHFGGLALDNNAWLSTTSEWLPSDTLFSAIVNTLARFCSEAETTRLAQLFVDGKIRISSGFYLLELPGKKVFFLPKPAHFMLETPDDDFKKYAAVRFISQTVWEAGWMPKDWKNECILLQNGKVLAAKTDLPESFKNEPFDSAQTAKIALYQVGDYPRVKVHTPERTDNFFHFTALHIADNGSLLPQSSVHLFFLVDQSGLDNTSDWKTIQAAIRMLPYEGIGGERAAGCGFFDGADFEPFSLNTAGSGFYASVSLTLPANEAELNRMKGYKLQTRGGRHYGGEGKKFDYVRMMAEGAVSAGAISGQCTVIGREDGHEVIRYGKAFCLPTVAISDQS